MKYINYRLTRLSIISAVTTLIFVMLFLLLLIGCSKDEEVARKEIHFVTWKPNIPGVQEEIIKYFEAEHPDIKVVREIGPHSSTAFHDLLTQKLKNKSEDVDVFLMDVIWPPEFAAAGWAMSLDEMFPESEQDKFLNGTILANIYKDKIYGVPLFIDSGMLYYRKDLLEKYGFKPPETWQNMVEKAQFIVSQESKEGNELYGFSGQFKQYEGLVCDMLEYILSNGGEII
ncbi:MAG: extracellular solute-binding protein, partial [Candidatus Aenigmarchaeota archaeon]|nr:extracellular solute-binding protein [Candidatus Aenigmarchaeota archaeon]